MVQLRRDESHAGGDDLDDGAKRASDQVHLVDDNQVDVLHVLALPPSSRDHVPVLGCGKDDRATLEKLAFLLLYDSFLAFEFVLP